MERVRQLANYFATYEANAGKFTNADSSNNIMNETEERVWMENEGIIDPYHFILIQHGFMGTTSDFSGLIRTLMEDHANALSEARSAAENAMQSDNTLSDGNNTNKNSEAKVKYVMKVVHKTPFNGKVYCSGNRVCFVPGVNNLLGSITGTRSCALKMLREFLPVFTAWLADVREAQLRRKTEYEHCYLPNPTTDLWNVNIMNMEEDRDNEINISTSASSHQPLFCYRTYKPIPVCFSCVGHSFGGVILREFLFLLLTDTSELQTIDENLYYHVKDVRETLMRLHVTFENFVTVASPHCGTSECLSPPLYNLAWYLSKLQHSKTIQELIHVDAEHVLTERLLNVHHLAALAPFRHRTLFANTTRDFLVGFGTSSLIFEPHVKDQVRMMGIEPDKVPCAAAFKDASAEVSEAIYLPLSNKHCTKSKQDMDHHHHHYNGANSNGSTSANNHSTYNSCIYNNLNTKANTNTHNNYENDYSLNASMTEEERLANHRFLTLPEELHDLQDALLTKENTQIHLVEHNYKDKHLDFDLSIGNNDDKVYNTENRYEYNNKKHIHDELQRQNRSESSALHYQQNNSKLQPPPQQLRRRTKSGLLDNNELKCYNYHFPYSTSLRETRDTILHENVSRGRSNVSSDNRFGKTSRATGNVSFDANCIDELQHNLNYNNIIVGDDNSIKRNNNEITVRDINNNNNNSNNSSSRITNNNKKTNIVHSTRVSKHNTFNTITYNNNSKNSCSVIYNKREPSVQNSLSMRTGLVRCQSNFIGPVESTHTITDIRAFYRAFHTFGSASPSSESSMQSFGERNVHHHHHHNNNNNSNNYNNNSNNRKINYKNAKSTAVSADDVNFEGLYDYTSNNLEKQLEHVAHDDNNNNNNNNNASYNNENEPSSAQYSDLQADHDTFIFDNSENDDDDDFKDDNSFELNSNDEGNHVEEPIFNCDSPSFAFTFSSINDLAAFVDEHDDNNYIPSSKFTKNANSRAHSNYESTKAAEDNNNNNNDTKCSMQYADMPNPLHENDSAQNKNVSKESVNTQLDDIMTISSERKSEREEYEVQSTRFHDAIEMYDNNSNNENDDNYENDDDDRYIDTISVTSKQSERHHVHPLPHSSLSLSSSSPVHLNNNNNNNFKYYKETDTPFTINVNSTENKTENVFHTKDQATAKENVPAIEEKNFKLSTVMAPSKLPQEGNNDTVHENTNNNTTNHNKAEVNWPALPSVTIIGSPRKRNCEELPLELIWQGQNTVLHNDYHDIEVWRNHQLNSQGQSGKETNTMTSMEKWKLNEYVGALTQETEKTHGYWQVITYPFFSSWGVLSWLHQKVLQLYKLRYASTMRHISRHNSPNSNISNLKDSNANYLPENLIHYYNSQVNEQNMINKNNSDKQHDSKLEEEFHSGNNAKINESNPIPTSSSATPTPQLTRVSTEIFNSASISADKSSPAIIELVLMEPQHEQLEQQKRITHSDTHRHEARHKRVHRESSICFSKREYALLPRSCALPRLIAETLRRHLDWRVRAIRYANAIPMAHIACLGTYEWLGASLAIAQAVSEEVATVLC